jgi:aspartate aminotransferase
MKAPLSSHFEGRKPSAIRQAQIFAAKRPDKDDLRIINLAIGNVTRPMHPAMQKRMRALGEPGSPFADGVVKYSASVGSEESQRAFLNVIASSGCDTEGLGCVVTDGGSMAMELMVLGVCGPGSARPLMLLDPAYTNYMDMAKRVCVPTVSVRRELKGGSFTTPDFAHLERVAKEERPLGLVIIPADNPTGQFLTNAEIAKIAKLCVEHNMWLVSDEAYRQLCYGDEPASSVWHLGDEDVPGIVGRRISIETASKVWNACGLRVGGLVTDNPGFHAKAVAEYTANLCSNAIGQYIFGALAHVSHEELRSWYEEQRSYYANMMREVVDGLRTELPGVIVTNADASLYSVVDVRDIAPAGFDASDFVAFCAQKGRVTLEGEDHTLLVSPMDGFYGRRVQGDACATQMRIAFVEPPEEMRKVPRLFA